MTVTIDQDLKDILNKLDQKFDKIDQKIDNLMRGKLEQESNCQGVKNAIGKG